MKTSSQNGIISLSLSLSLSLFLLLFPILSIPVGAQTVRGTPGTNLYPYSRFTSSLAIIIAVLITSVFSMIFFFIYIRYCSYSYSTVTVPIRRSRHAAEAAAARGLDSSVIETFPTFSYSEVKDHKLGKGVLECAVCLNEFEDDETLRLIPKCDHVFHPECIDAWLESHVTCPVCRADLVPQPGDEPVRVPDLTIVNEEIHDDGNSRNDEIVIQVGNENQQRKLKRMNRNLSFQYPNRPPKGPMNRNLSFQYPNRPPKVPMNRTPVVGVNRVNRNLSFGKLNRPHRSWSMRPRMFGRSYSMGNMLVQPGEDIERFTLRLPSEVRKEVVNRAMLNRTRSFATNPVPEPAPSVEGTWRKGYESEPIERSNREVKSDRWVFFTRALSMTMRSPKAVIHTGEGSVSTLKGSGSKTLGKLRSFNCLEPKTSHETGHFSYEPARSPV